MPEENKENKSTDSGTPRWGVAGHDENGEVRLVGNHIYYYAPIINKHIATLVDNLHSLSNKIRAQAIENGCDVSPIVLHINSGGGSVIAGIAAMDAVRRSPVPVHAIVDGICASAATLPFMVASKRIMGAGSYMLIHQLSSIYFGTYEQLKDCLVNSKELMRLIRKVYLKRTSIPKKKLDRILRHDLVFNAKKCLKLGMADEVA